MFPSAQIQHNSKRRFCGLYGSGAGTATAATSASTAEALRLHAAGLPVVPDVTDRVRAVASEELGVEQKRSLTSILRPCSSFLP
jgi:hypothetical protein